MSLLESAGAFLRRATPLPRFLSLSPVAFDVTDGAVRTLRLDRDGGNLVPGCALEVCVEGGLSAPAPAPASVAVCKTLPEAIALGAERCAAEQVVACIPERVTYLFTAKLPAEALDNLRSALEFKVQENVPLPPDAVSFDYEVISRTRGEVEVAVTAVPLADVEMRLARLEAAGLTVVAFDSEARALVRALVPRGDLSPHLILNLEPDAVTAVIAERGVAQFSSIISVSGAKAANPDSPEATQLKEEVNKLLVYWFTGRGDDPRPKVEDAIVAGPHAAEAGLVDFLSRGLQIRARPGNVWENCFPPGAAVPEIPRARSFAFAVAAGLALLPVE